MTNKHRMTGLKMEYGREFIHASKKERQENESRSDKTQLLGVIK